MSLSVTGILPAKRSLSRARGLYQSRPLQRVEGEEVLEDEVSGGLKARQRGASSNLKAVNQTID